MGASTDDSSDCCVEGVGVGGCAEAVMNGVRQDHQRATNARGS